MKTLRGSTMKTLRCLAFTLGLVLSAGATPQQDYARIQQICQNVVSESIFAQKNANEVTNQLISNLHYNFKGRIIELDDFSIYTAVRYGLSRLEPFYVNQAIQSIFLSLFNRNIDLDYFNKRFANNNESTSNPGGLNERSDRGGLKNQGITCYQNSVIQAMRWCNPLNVLLMSNIYRSNILTSNKNDQFLVSNFSQIMEELNNPKLNHANDPKTFSDIAAVSFFGKENAHLQQDAQEFLMSFLDKLHKTNVLTEAQRDKIVISNFSTCMTCFTSEKTGVENTYQLQLKFVQDGEITIEKLLKESITGEDLRSDVECDFCTIEELLKNSNETRKQLEQSLTENIKRGCKNRYESLSQLLEERDRKRTKTTKSIKKQLAIAAAQEFIVLHIGRGSYDEDAAKIKTLVTSSNDGIVNIPSSDGTTDQFRIASAIVHSGDTLKSGHYYTITWDGVYNDGKVDHDGGNSMRNFLTLGYHDNGGNQAQGYLYFLERIRDKNTPTATQYLNKSTQGFTQNNNQRLVQSQPQADNIQVNRQSNQMYLSTPNAHTQHPAGYANNQDAKLQMHMHNSQFPWITANANTQLMDNSESRWISPEEHIKRQNNQMYWSAPNTNTQLMDNSQSRWIAPEERNALVHAHHLINNNAVNIKDGNGKTALHLAADNNHLEVVKVLLEAPNIQVNTQDNAGWTALHFAVYSGHLEVVKRLLSAPGIDLKIKAKDNWTALMLAIKNKHQDVIDIFKAIRQKK